MQDFELFTWIIFMLWFSLIPLKSIVKFFLTQLGIEEEKDTTPFLYEAGDHEHYAQLYRPGDRRYKEITRLCEKAKPVN